jgi:hypothetical protein
MIIDKHLRSLLVLVGLTLTLPEMSAPLRALPSMVPRAGNLLGYTERPVKGVDDRDFNRFWGDRLNFVDWNAVKPARIISATFELPDSRKLTATMLSDRDDCDVDACPLRLFDGNDMVGELKVCEDTTRHQVVAEKWEFRACGRSFDLSELIGRADALKQHAERTLVHNGSIVNMVRLGGGNVEIRYLSPRRGLSGTLRGQILFKGTEDKQHRFSGMAYTFKGACTPAGYVVNGAIDANGEIVLLGQAPTWDPKSCSVLGFTTQSPHAKLIFANVPVGE